MLIKKRILALFVLVLCISITNASNLYWVGGSGSWSDSKHWSFSTGGISAGKTPSKNDIVFFDENSFSDDNQQVVVSGKAYCKSFIARSINHSAIFLCEKGNSIYVSNDFKFNAKLNLTFNGSFYFGEQDVTQLVTKLSQEKSKQKNRLSGPSPQLLALTATATTTNTSCNGICDGTATVVVAGGSGSYDYLWSPGGQTTATITGLCPGTYICGITDQVTSESALSNSAAVTEPSSFITVPSTVRPTCFGLCDGRTSSLVGGGTSPYTYVWSNGQTTVQATGLCAGTYTVNITDANGCTTRAINTVTQPAVLAPNGTSANIACNGSCNGSASVAPTGGTSPYNYLWSSSQTTSSRTGLCAGSFTITVTDTRGCTATYLPTIIEPTVLSATVTPTNVTCGGLSTGAASASVGGGTSPYSYSWTGTAQTTSSITGMAAGSYTLTITDASLCTSVRAFTITEPAILNSTPSNTNVTCNAACDGTASAGALGGTAPYSYLWSVTSQTTVSVTALCAGIYSVTITDANLCTAVGTRTVTEPAVLASNPSNVNISCNGACDGTGTAAPTGGTAPYSYLWSNAQTTATATGLCAGNYTVTVLDANSCIATGTILVTEPAVLSAGPSSSNLSCNGVCNGTASTAAAGGTSPYTYSWSNSSTSSAIVNLCAGGYTVTITDTRGCTQSQSYTITQPGAISATIATNSVSCNAACSGVAAASVFGGTAPFGYTWSNGGTTATITGLCAGIYTVTVLDANSCSTTANTTVNEPTAIVLGTTPIDATCNGFCDGSATSSVFGGTAPYSYLWATGGETTTSINGVCAGSYTLTLTDANGCVSSSSLTISQPSTLSANPTSTALTCSGACDGTSTANPTGGTPPYTYLWSAGFQTTQTINSLCAAVYAVIVEDANGCESNQNTTVTQPASLSADITGTTPTCLSCNGVASATGSGGTAPYTYLWSDGQTSSSATALCIGNYTITVIDGGGCVATNTVNVDQSVNITVNFSVPNITCNGACDGIVTASPIGGSLPYTYVWSPGGETTATLTGLCAGTYSVQVTDGGGCFNEDDITLTDPAVLTLTASAVNSSCNGLCDGSANSSPAGGTLPYTFLWSPGGQTSQNITGLCAGTYTVDLTDANGCSATYTVAVSENPPIDPNEVVTTASCLASDGDIATFPTGGNGTYSYSWLPGGMTTQNIANLSAGNYTLTITDGLSCFEDFVIGVSNTGGPVNTSTITNVDCYSSCNGIIDITLTVGNNPFTYVWSNGETTIGISNLCAGNYNVVVTDAIGCISIDPFTITEPDSVSTNPVQNNVSCNGLCDGDVAIAPSGGTAPYTYLWSVGGATDASITGLCSGTYNLDITDGNGCVSSHPITITEPAVLSFTIDATNSSCNGVNDGGAVAFVSGGTTPYTYLWSPGGQIISTIANQAPGTYTLQVTDANGCSDTQTTTITEPAVLSSTLTTTNTLCNLSCDGTASLNVEGGTTPYAYSWSNGETNNSVIALCSGSYNVNLTDANGCLNTHTLTITQPNAISPGIISTSVTCNGTCNGTISTSATGGTTPFTYLWSTGATETSVSALCAGTHTLTITDNNNCISTNVVTISQPSILQANPFGVNPSCAGGCNGLAASIPVGGRSPYTYSWSTGALTPSVNNLCSNTYTVVVTDANACTDLKTVTLSDPIPIDVISAVGSANCGVCNGTIGLTPSGGTGPYSYAWSNGLSTQNVVNICAGLYAVTVTDVSSCTALFAIPVGNTGGPTGEIVTSANPTCNSVCDGTVTVSPIGGTTPYSYLWAPGGQTDSTLTSLCDGTYILQVTDANTCLHFVTVDIAEPDPIASNETVTNATCFGICDGAIKINPTGGTAPYTFIWDTGEVTDSIFNACAGDHIVNITDASFCVFVDTITIGQNTTVSINTISATQPSCPGNCDASAEIIATGGTSPYDYNWSTGDVTTSISNICGGNYVIQATDNIGCIGTATIVISDPAPIQPNQTVTDATCGSCNGAMSLNPTGGSGGYSYLWSNSETGSTVTNLCAGVYDVVISDGSGCTVSSNLIVNNSAGPTGETIATTSVSCSGLCDGSAIVTPSGGTFPYTYLWTASGATTSNINNLCGGDYIVQIIDANNCIRTTSVSIAEPAAIALNPAITDATCNLCDGSILLSPTGGAAPYLYNWSNSETTDNINNVCAGLYSLTITDASGCSQINSLPVVNPTGPSLTTAITNASCYNSCNGGASVTPLGAAPYTYLWDNGETNDVVSNLCAGLYNVVVTDNAGCINIASITIAEPNAIQFNSSNLVQPPCASNCNGSITTLPFGGSSPYTYLWSPSGVTQAKDTALCTGTYTVTITDANGCAYAQSYFLDVNSNGINPNEVIVDAACGVCDGQALLSPSGGTAPYSYAWSNNETADAASGLCAGIYGVVITDNFGCTSAVNLTINNSGGPTGETITTTSVSCYGNCTGVANIAPIGGTTPYTYYWPSSGATTSSVSGLCAGNYLVQVIDSNSCIRTTTVDIAEPAPFQLNPIITDASCGLCDGAANLNPTGGSSPYLFVWNNSATDANITGLCAAVYTITVTDAAGCALVSVVPIVNPTGPLATITSTDAICFNNCDGTASALPSGGNGPFTYLWDNGETTNAISNLCAGTHFVQITDNFNCIGITSVTIDEPSQILLGAPNSVDPLCNGTCDGSLTALPIGGTLPYSYSWTNGNTGATAIALCSGPYTVTLTDALGCVKEQTNTLTDPPAIAISFTVVDAACNSAADGAIDITATGGTPSYTYQWSGGSSSTAEDLSGLLPGTYTITVTDNNGCLYSQSDTVQATLFISATVGNDTSFCEQSTITLIGANSNATSYQWLEIPSQNVVGSNDTISIVPPAGVTSYVFVAINGACTNSDTIVLTSNAVPVADAGPTTTIFSNGTTTIGGNPTGSAGSTFVWSPGSSLNDSLSANPIVTPNGTTQYTVVVTNAFGCTSSDTVTVNVLPKVVFNSGFSPNKDGVNDFWEIENIQKYPNCVVEIYNRWGELLFSSQGYTTKWDGTFKNKDLPVGTYYYTITLNDPEYPDTFTGPITILR